MGVTANTRDAGESAPAASARGRWEPEAFRKDQSFSMISSIATPSGTAARGAAQESAGARLRRRGLGNLGSRCRGWNWGWGVGRKRGQKAREREVEVAAMAGGRWWPEDDGSGRWSAATEYTGASAVQVGVGAPERSRHEDFVGRDGESMAVSKITASV